MCGVLPSFGVRSQFELTGFFYANVPLFTPIFQRQIRAVRAVRLFDENRRVVGRVGLKTYNAQTVNKSQRGRVETVGNLRCLPPRKAVRFYPLPRTRLLARL